MNNEYMNPRKKKKHYEKVSVAPLSVVPENYVLASSIVNNSVIQSTGQELGPEYDFSSSTDLNTGKTFSTEWDQSF